MITLSEGFVGLLIHVVAYWSAVAFHGGKAQQVPANEAPGQSVRSVRDVAPLVAFNQALSVLMIPMMRTTKMSFWIAPLQVFLLVAAYDLAFGALHWAVHRAPRFLSRVHHTHHTLRRCFGAGALYAHPVEHLAINVGALLVACFVVGPSVVSLAAFVGLATWNTVLAHCPGCAHADGHHGRGSAPYGNWPFAFDGLRTLFQ